MQTTRKVDGFTVVELLVVIAIIVILVAMFLPAVRTVREPARRTTCMNNLRQLALATLNYESSHMQFPSCRGADGQTGDAQQLSGMIELLPFIEQNDLYRRITEPSEYPELADFDPRPAPWTEDFPPYQRPLEVLLCPSSSYENIPFGEQSYGFCIGDRARNVASPESLRGVFGGTLAMTFDDISDGTSNTVMLGEIKHWAGANVSYEFAIERGESILNDPSSVLSLVDEGKKGYLPGVKLSAVGRGSSWADGRSGVAQFNTILPPKSPTALVGGVGSDGMMPASGPHPGAVMVVFADGSTHSIAEDIDCGDSHAPALSEAQMEGRVASRYGVWGALGTIAGGETSLEF